MVGRRPKRRLKIAQRRNARDAAQNMPPWPAPQSTIDEQDLERALLRKSVGALADGRHDCADCGRTPLIGETLYRYAARRDRLRAVPPAAPRRARRAASACATASTATRCACAACARRRSRRPPGRFRRRWSPSRSTTTIARPREEVFEYLADVANHAEFSDHCLVDWHLTREDSYGRGAGARFRVEVALRPLLLRRHHARRARRRPRGSSRPAAAGASTASGSRSTWTLEDGRAGHDEGRRSRPSRRPAEVRRAHGEAAARAQRRRRAATSARSSGCARSSRRASGRGARATVAGGARKPASGFRL